MPLVELENRLGIFQGPPTGILVTEHEPGKPRGPPFLFRAYLLFFFSSFNGSIFSVVQVVPSWNRLRYIISEYRTGKNFQDTQLYNVYRPPEKPSMPDKKGTISIEESFPFKEPFPMQMQLARKVKRVPPGTRLRE